MHKISCLLLILWVTASSCRKSSTEDPGVDPVITPITAASGLIAASVEFPTADESFVLTFDASKGNKALLGLTGDVYMYTGVITDKSVSQADWKYVKSASFNEPDAAAKMTAAGSGKYQITLEPRKFYGVPASEKILKLVMLFRNADGSLVSRNADASDIYLPIYESGKLAVKFINPELNPTYNPSPVISVNVVGEELTVSGLSSSAADLSLSLNGTSFATAANTKSISGKVTLSNAGNQEIKIKASANGSTAETAYQFVITGTVQVAALPAGAKEGVVFINGGQSAILTLTAPGKQGIYAIGDFNDWQANAAHFMKKTPDGNTWWVQIDQLDASKSYAYQYLIDGKIKVADPYTEVVLDPDNDRFINAGYMTNLPAYPAGKTNGIVSVMQANKGGYTYKNNNFSRPEKNKLVIYELHLRDFLKSNNYNTLTDTLNYLTQLGVNAVELMPVNEFEGNSSWGYNTSFHFAADKFYGNKAMLQRFIDECHSRGIAVILDMVLNHAFGQSPMVQMYFDQATGKPASNSPWFNADPTHPFNVGYDMNHESAATKNYTKNVIKYWMQEYKIDGYRFDLSKGFTQKNSGTTDAAVGQWSSYDASRVAIWKDYNNYIKSLDANNFYVILEHFGDDNEEKELSEQGMMLWNNVNGSFNEGTMGYVANSDFSRGMFGTHGFTKPDNLVTFFQSHDEERTMTKNLAYGNSAGTYNVKDLNTALKREELAAAFLFTIPGPKLLWQFQELGYEVGININGRTGEKPVYWNYYQQPARKALYNAYSRFIKMKRNNPVYNTTNLQSGLAGAVKYIKLIDNSNTLIVVGNFDVVSHAANVDFGTAGPWYEAGTNETINVNAGKYTQNLAPGEYHIYSRSPLSN